MVLLSMSSLGSTCVEMREMLRKTVNEAFFPGHAGLKINRQMEGF